MKNDNLGQLSLELVGKFVLGLVPLIERLGSAQDYKVR
jgi:hypothetical protein